MTQEARSDYLIKGLCEESGKFINLNIDEEDKRTLFRSLMNVRMPMPISEEFLKIQDDFLQEELMRKGVVPLKDIPTIRDEFKSNIKFADKISLWQGDITRLATDAIVNAANSGMLGCFVPCHRCIDNAIHSAAGIGLREECFHIMQEQGMEEKNGKAKITKAYNLPCRYVIHTVGPIVRCELTKDYEEDLRSCYRSCLSCAAEHKVRTIAFCCISTGEFHFPHKRAAQIAIETVLQFLDRNEDKIDRVIFNVFQDLDCRIYKEIMNFHRKDKANDE